MRTISSAALAFGTSLLAACAVTRQQTASGFHPPPPGYHVIVMQPDVAVGQVTAGGVVEQREDWTNQGRDNVLKALAAQEAAEGAVAKIATTVEDTGWDPAAARDLIALHRAVGAAIAAHKPRRITSTGRSVSRRSPSAPPLITTTHSSCTRGTASPRAAGSRCRHWGSSAAR
jgi:hypothetical protein